jgi:hypothetical protein
LTVGIFVDFIQEFPRVLRWGRQGLVIAMRDGFESFVAGRITELALADLSVDFTDDWVWRSWRICT